MKDQQTTVKDLLFNIVSKLCSYKEDVSIEEVGGSHAVIWTVHVNPNDVGKIVGKGGSTIDAIRHIVRAITAMEHGGTFRAHVDVVQPQGSESNEKKSFRASSRL